MTSKKTEQRSAVRGRSSWVPVWLALAVLPWAPGCGDECVDAFDCRNDHGSPPEGERYVCTDGTCDTVPIDEETEPDAGPVDSGTPDAGPVDAGTPDAGPVDSGTADAGPVDSGTPDAGPEDAGTPDAGPVDCATTPYDPVLGTLQLQSGFQVGQSSTLPDNVVAVTATPGPTYSLYGVVSNSSGINLYSLGTWPQVALGGAPLYDTVAPDDRAPGVTRFAGSYLVNDGQRLLTGYTKSGTGFPGQLAVYDTAMPASSQYVSAPSNFSAGAVTNAFLINGGGVGSTVSGLAIYGLVTSSEPFTSVVVATLPANVGGSGFTAVADNGIAVLGYSDSSFTNQAHAVSPAKIQAALTSTTPVVLASEPQLNVGSNFVAVSSFGNGAAVVRGNYDDFYNFLGPAISRFALSGDPVTIGARTPVLNYVDTCTNVTALYSLGPDLLVGVEDKNGKRLVQVQQQAQP